MTEKLSSKGREGGRPGTRDNIEVEAKQLLKDETFRAQKQGDFQASSVFFVIQQRFTS